MSTADIIVIVLIAAAVTAAVVHIVRNRGKNCCGDCSSCSGKDRCR